MKADKETTLFRVLTGSHLYGTATEKSDFDYKAVVLPKLSDLLLNKRVTNRKEKPEGQKAGDKMVAGETETEYLPLQVFLDDFFNGQTYALEVAFAASQGLHEAYDMGNGETANWWHIKHMMGMLISDFTTKNVKKMVGYAVSQSRLYGMKTQRYTSIKNFIQTVEDHFMLESGAAQGRALMKELKMEANPMLIDKLLALEHVKSCTLLINNNTQTASGLDVCGKTFPLTNRWETVVTSMRTTLENYGERVKEFDGEGVDWKALSHAVRITEQVLELCGTGNLEFPRPNAEFLRAVKNGQCPLDVATRYLEDTFAKVDEAVATSVLRERTPALEAEFEAWKLDALMNMYGLS